MAADPHDMTTTSDAPPMSDAAFLADRQQFWEGFMRFAFWSIAATALTLILLLIFVG